MWNVESQCFCLFAHISIAQFIARWIQLTRLFQSFLTQTKSDAFVLQKQFSFGSHSISIIRRRREKRNRISSQEKRWKSKRIWIILLCYECSLFASRSLGWLLRKLTMGKSLKFLRRKLWIAFISTKCINDFAF